MPRRSDAETIARYELFRNAILLDDEERSIAKASRAAEIGRKLGAEFLRLGAFSKPRGPQLRPPVMDLIKKRDAEAATLAARKDGLQRLVEESLIESAAETKAK